MYHPSLYNIPDDTALRIAQLIQDSKSGSEAVNSTAQALYVQKKEAPRDGFSRSFFILNLGQENYAKSSCPSTPNCAIIRIKFLTLSIFAYTEFSGLSF